MPIRILPPALVDRIAAGEVIERPANVVKELVENALDAGASRIEVEVGAAGRQRIRVVDDGGGIPADELPLAVRSHATSKLVRDDDLDHVRTLGFRGEALASIAAVSRLRVASRPADADGAEIHVEGGTAGEVRAAGMAPGTTIEVADLFYNTPARAKFLRADTTEAGRITDTVARLALARPDVRFALTHDDRRVLSLPPAKDLRERVAAIHGPELARALLEAEAEEPDLRVRLLLAPVSLARRDTERQVIILNDRPVRDRTIAHAVTDACSRFLEPGRRPVFYLRLDLDPSRVDVNVHPAKQEVRLADGRRIHRVMAQATRAALQSAEGGTGLSLDDASRVHPNREATAEAQDRVREAIADFYATPRSATAPDRPYATVSPTSRPAPSSPREPAELFPGGVGRVMQVHRAYIVCETPTGIEIVDPHALHERILLETMRTRIRAGDLAVQRLLVPVRVEVDATEREAAISFQDTFAEAGLDVAPFSEHSLVVRSVPALLGGRDPAPLVRDLLSDLVAGGPRGTDGVDRAALLDRVLGGLACRAAVRFGQDLPEAEIRRLLAQRTETEGAFACAHGRPTALAVSLADLKRRFHR